MKESAPLKLAVGVKVTEAESVLGAPATQGLLVIVPNEPLVGPETMANVSSQVSTSEPVRVTTTAVSWLVDRAALSSAVGAQLMEMVTVAGDYVTVPSFVV